MVKNEGEILDLWSFGFNDSEISERLDCSTSHVYGVREKYNLSNNNGVVRLINFFKKLNEGPKYPGELEFPRVKYISAKNLGYDVCRFSLRGQSIYFLYRDRKVALNRIVSDTNVERQVELPNYTAPFQRSVGEFLGFLSKMGGFDG